MIEVQLGFSKLSEILSAEVGYWTAQYNKDWKSEEMGAAIAESIRVYQDFRTAYIQFFIDNLGELDIEHKEWLLNKMYAMLFSHWELIQRSAEQYTVPQNKLLLDKGYAYILACKEQGEILNIPAILYFEKVGKAKRFPFTPVYAIGIPMFDAYQDDWSAIPHELGHHIYWNSEFTINGEKKIPLFGDKNIFSDMIERAVDSVNLPPTKKTLLKKKLKAWEEEIFAEAAGTLLGTMAGSVDYTEAIWDKLRKQTRVVEDLFIDDGNHPLPLFLPYIREYAKTIFLSSNTDPVTDASWINNLHLEPQKFIETINNPRGLSVTEIKSALKNFLQETKALQRNDLSTNKFEDILSLGLIAAPKQKLIERALDVNFKYLEKNEFTCVLCGLKNQGNAGSSPCSSCGMPGSIATAATTSVKLILGW